MRLRVKNRGNFASRSKSKAAKGITLWPLNRNGRLLFGFASRTGLAGGLAILATFHAAGRLLLGFALAAAGTAADEDRRADERGAEGQEFDEFHLDLIGSIFTWRFSSEPPGPARLPHLRQSLATTCRLSTVS